METLCKAGITSIHSKEPMSSIQIDQNLSIASIKMAPAVPYTYKDFLFYLILRPIAAHLAFTLFTRLKHDSRTENQLFSFFRIFANYVVFQTQNVNNN